MPYIPEPRQMLVPKCLKALTPGELNFQVSCLIRDYYRENPSYTRINDVMGVLSAAAAEFYRRVAVPYEDEKIVINGDVY